MTLRLLPYFLKQALVSMKNHRVVYLIGLGTMVVSLLIPGSFSVAFTNLNAWIQEWGRGLTFTVYLAEEVNESRTNAIGSHIRGLPGAEISEFISKERAWTELKRTLGSRAGLLEGLPENPLPASFEVLWKESPGEKANPKKIKQMLENIEGVEEVQYNEEWVTRFEGILNILRVAGLIAVGLLCMAVLFIVANTIKLAIYARREEIEILKLVGATDWFVKMPFLLEGLIQGILSGLVAVLILYSGYLFLTARKFQFLGMPVMDFVFMPKEHVISIVALSMILGLLGSLIALRRFFDV